MTPPKVSIVVPSFNSLLVNAEFEIAHTQSNLRLILQDETAFCRYRYESFLTYMQERTLVLLEKDHQHQDAGSKQRNCKEIYLKCSERLDVL
jgi:hypothetical protein